MVTIGAAVLGCGYVLLRREPFAPDTGWVWLFIAVHSGLLARNLLHGGAGAVGFVHGRGFGRDAIWLHTTLAAVGGVACVWGPATLIIWSHLRSAYQDEIMQNAFYPIFASSELWLPFMWLGGYAMAWLVSCYVYARNTQPATAPLHGGLLALAFAVSALVIKETYPRRYPDTWMGLVPVLLALAAILLVGARLLHRSREVV